jgi:20S proteasome alpha/beta subunit
MTLCIAATCLDKKGARIVVSSDWKQEVGDFASSEIQNKLHWLFKGAWCVLIAGVVPNAHSLVTTLRQSIGHNKLTKLNIEDELTRAVLLHKSKLVERHVMARHNVTFDYFQTNRTEFDEAQWAETSTRIEKINLDCQLIVCTFIKRSPLLFLVDEDGSVRRDENFLAIGTGSTIANSVLCFRGQHEDSSLEGTAYNVFEATKFARMAKTPGVGKVHAFSVLLPGKRQKRLRPSGIRKLRKYFDKFGPHGISSLSLPKSHWERYW